MSISVSPPTIPVRKFSNQMLAVLLIFSADPSLMRMVESHIDMAADVVRWDEIRKIPFSSGHFGAVTIAYAIWTDQVLEGTNPFDSALNMDLPLKRACLQALSMRWGLKA